MANRTSSQLAAAKARQASNKGTPAPTGSLPALQSSLTKTSAPTVTDPYSTKEYKSLQDSLTGSMAPTADEQAATTALGNIDKEQSDLALSSKLGISNVEGQAIPMGFVTGQTAAINKQTGLASEAISAKAVPLKTQLAALQAQRQAAQDVAKEQIAEYQNKIQYQTAQQQTAASKAESDRTFSENQRQFNAQEGRLSAAQGSSGSAATTRQNSALNALLEKAATMPSGGREWAQSVAKQYGVDPNAVAQVTSQNGWETAFNPKFGQSGGAGGKQAASYASDGSYTYNEKDRNTGKVIFYDEQGRPFVNE